jgi:hypothetical protein
LSLLRRLRWQNKNVFVVVVVARRSPPSSIRKSFHIVVAVALHSPSLCTGKSQLANVENRRSASAHRNKTKRLRRCRWCCSLPFVVLVGKNKTLSSFVSLCSLVVAVVKIVARWRRKSAINVHNPK